MSIQFNADKNQYSIQEDGIHFTRKDGKTVSLLWGSLRSIKKSVFGKAMFLRGRGGSIPLAPLSPESQAELLLSLFSEWRKSDPDAAKKAAFDYVDQQKGFSSFLIGSCVFFAFPLAAVLMAESLQEYSCSKALRQNPVLSVANITKMTRKSDGPYLLDLEFTSLDGKHWKGKDQYIVEENAPPPPAQIPFVYDRDNTKCWSLTPSATNQNVNWAKRRFFEAYTFLFGLFFAVSGLFGLLWGIAKKKEDRPYREEIATAFGIR